MLQSMGSHRVGHDQVADHHHTHLYVSFCHCHFLAGLRGLLASTLCAGGWDRSYIWDLRECKLCPRMCK